VYWETEKFMEVPAPGNPWGKQGNWLKNASNKGIIKHQTEILRYQNEGHICQESIRRGGNNYTLENEEW